MAHGPRPDPEQGKPIAGIESPASGVLGNVTDREGDVIPVGQTIAVIAAPSDMRVPEPQPAVMSVRHAGAAAAPEPPAVVKAFPLVRNIAEQHGIDMSQIKTLGGRVEKADVLAHAPMPARYRGCSPRQGSKEGEGMEQKARGLALLRERIIRDLFVNEWRDVWFFPPFNGVDGWAGTQDIMFVGLNPSTGRFPSIADRNFYAVLKRTGLEHAHLTDVIKERARGPDVARIERDPARMDRYWRYLREEIEILCPRLIVGLGQRALRLLTDRRGSEAPLKGIPHYAQLFPSPATRRQFTRELQSARAHYERM